MTPAGMRLVSGNVTLRYADVVEMRRQASIADCTVIEGDFENITDICHHIAMLLGHGAIGCEE